MALDPGHPDTLIARYLVARARASLATGYSRAGRAGPCLRLRQFARSVMIHKQIVEERAKALGPDHPDTLTARRPLALTSGQAAGPVISVTVPLCDWPNSSTHVIRTWSPGWYCSMTVWRSDAEAT